VDGTGGGIDSGFILGLLLFELKKQSQIFFVTNIKIKPLLVCIFSYF